MALNRTQSGEGRQMERQRSVSRSATVDSSAGVTCQCSLSIWLLADRALSTPSDTVQTTASPLHSILITQNSDTERKMWSVRLLRDSSQAVFDSFVRHRSLLERWCGCCITCRRARRRS